jgi:anti-anti-sigma factor
MVSPARFGIKQTKTDSTLKVSVTGELDMRTSDVLWQQIDKSLEGGITELTLDLRDLDFIDSTGLRLLITLHNRSQEEEWRLRLLSPQHEAATLVLRITGTDAALPFELGEDR